MGEDARLRRSLGLPLVTLYGLGNILGAGIYVLIGKVAGFAGSSTTLAFVLAMVTAGITAFSYMELSGRYPVSASVSVYLHRAFGNAGCRRRSAWQWSAAASRRRRHWRRALRGT